MDELRKVVAIVGMTGSGKSEVTRAFQDAGFAGIRFGDITDDEMKKRSLIRNEANERYCRELLRKEMGMAAYAILNRPRIDKALETSDVVADGLYSWEEYLDFKGYYGDRFCVVAVCSPPKTRYARLAVRQVRPLTSEEAASRDKSEIENLNKGGPIAMADYVIVNEHNLDYLLLQSQLVIAKVLKTLPDK
jgi:dephospho-CoA kinase